MRDTVISLALGVAIPKSPDELPIDEYFDLRQNFKEVRKTTGNITDVFNWTPSAPGKAGKKWEVLQSYILTCLRDFSWTFIPED